MNVENIKLRSDVTVFIGENGCGKSEILNQLSSKYVNNGQDVIAIAHCIHDKFDTKLFNKKNFSFLGARSGSEMTTIALKEVLKTFNKKNKSNSILSQVFEYVGYHPSIGLSIELNASVLDSLSITLSKSNTSSMRHSDVERLIKIYSSIPSNDNLIWFDFNYRDYGTFTNVKYNDLIVYEKELIGLGVIKKINYFLRKGEQTINLEQASSGELYQIANISYIASKIKSNSIIFIDEPENSLHPKWQKEYINKLFDFFSLYTPKFVLATHSPLMLSSLNFSSNVEASIYRVEKFKINEVKYNASNVEGILWDMFCVITPENNYLSNLLVKLMNDLNEGNRTLVDVVRDIDSLALNTIDPRQESALKEVRKMAIDLDSGYLDK